MPLCSHLGWHFYYTLVGIFLSSWQCIFMFRYHFHTCFMAFLDMLDAFFIYFSYMLDDIFHICWVASFHTLDGIFPIDGIFVYAMFSVLIWCHFCCSLRRSMLSTSVFFGSAANFSKWMDVNVSPSCPPQVIFFVFLFAMTLFLLVLS